jgi:hypothetical protein
MLLSFLLILFVFYLLAVYVIICKLFFYLLIFHFNMDTLFLGNQFFRSKVPVVIELPDKLY